MPADNGFDPEPISWRNSRADSDGTHDWSMGCFLPRRGRSFRDYAKRVSNSLMSTPPRNSFGSWIQAVELGGIKHEVENEPENIAGPPGKT